MNDPDAHCADPNRLNALQRYGILDTPQERDFDDLSRLAALICETPVALISFVDCHRQWFKSKIGLEIGETSLENSICRRAILEDKILVVPDTLADPRFRAMPICINDPYMRFYAGAVIRTSDGHALGTVCVLDYHPRELSERQLEALQLLARQVLSMLELRRQSHHEKLANLSLARTEQRYSALMKATSDVLWTNSPEGEMQGEQPDWSRFTGQTEAEYQGHGWSSVVHPEDRQPTLDAWEHAVQTRTRFDFQHRVRRKDGEWRYCLIRAIPVIENDAVREWLGVHTDITAVKNGEAPLREIGAGALH